MAGDQGAALGTDDIPIAEPGSEPREFRCGSRAHGAHLGLKTLACPGKWRLNAEGAGSGLGRWLLALGILATLAANVAHGWSHGPVGAAVVAWPAASLVGSYELLLWLIRTAAAGAVVRELIAVHPAGPVDHRSAELRLVQIPDLDSAGISGVGGRSGVDDIDRAAVTAYRVSVEEGKPLSERKLAAMFGKTSRRWARHRMAEAMGRAVG